MLKRHLCSILLMCICLLPGHIIVANAKNDTISEKSDTKFGNESKPSVTGSGKPGNLTSKPIEINVLDTYGAGKYLNSETIATAINKADPEKKVVLFLKAGRWKISHDLEIPVNLSLKFEKGAFLSIDHGSKVIVNGPIVADMRQIFRGSGKVYFGESEQDVHPAWWKNTEDKFYTLAIQKALLSGAKSVYLSEGIYEVAIKKESVNRSIKIPSRVRIYGEGKKTVVKLVETPRTNSEWAANDLFAGKDIEDVEISRMTFDAEKFYPDPEITSRRDPSIKGTRAINISNAKNINIRDCHFQGFTNGSIYIKGENINIDKNSFYHGSYRTQTIRLDGSKNVTVSNNVFEDNGPHYYMRPGMPDETASTDAIMVGYNVEKGYIYKNTIKKTSGNGIRVEKSTGIDVVENTIYDVGQDGVTFYLLVKNSSCRGNTIKYWGKIGDFGYFRKQDGTIYNPKEYHWPPPDKPNLPQRLADSRTWERNRYFLRGVSDASIPDYDPSDYKSVFTFRGFSGISVTDLSSGIKITDNIIIGNRTMTNGLYNYASNYGINIGTHCINPPSSSGDCIISNNTISDSIDYDLYCPQYVDPTGKKGIATPSIVFGNNCDSAKILFYYRK